MRTRLPVAEFGWEAQVCPVDEKGVGIDVLLSSFKIEPRARPLGVRKYSRRGGWLEYSRLSTMPFASISLRRWDSTLAARVTKACSKS